MKFTVDRPGLAQMVKQVGKKSPPQTRSDPKLRLFACAARVFVESNGVVAGTEGLVFEDGQCVVSRKLFGQILGTYKGKKHLTIEADARGLRIERFTMGVQAYSAQVVPPAHFQVFTPKNIADLLPEAGSGAGGEGEDTEAGSWNLGPYKDDCGPQYGGEGLPDGAAGDAGSGAVGRQGEPSDGGDWVLGVVVLVRRIIQLPGISARQALGLQRLLFGLESLPTVSPGIAVEINVGERLGASAPGPDLWLVQLNPGRFCVSRCVQGRRVECVFQSWAVGQRFPLEVDAATGDRLRAWVEGLERLLGHYHPQEGVLHVYDAT